MRFGTSRESLRVKDLFTRYVRDEFLKSDLLHDVSFDRHSTAEEFHRACRHVAGKVIGLTLCRPVSVSDVMVYLGRQQRHVQDYWQSMPLFDLPVMFIEVLEHTSLFVLESVYMSTPDFAPRGIFFTMTWFSAQRCMGGRTFPYGQPLREVLQEWRNRYNNGEPFKSEHEGTVAQAIAMPLPHAMLCNSGQWRYWGFPVASGRRGGGLGLAIIKPWISVAGDLRPFQQADIEDPMHELAPDLLQGLGDCMRLAAQNEASQDQLRFYIGWVQNLRTTMLRHSLGLSRRVYSMSQMVQFMLVAGLLTQGGHLYHVVIGSLKAAIQDKAVQNHYVQMMSSKHALPSPSTLYRHRLTLHMAFCRLAQEQMRSMLSDGLVVRWGTMDSSPQRAHNWLMVGFATMRVSDLGPSLQLAHRLYELRASRDEQELTEASDAMYRLKVKLELVPAVPTTVASGRASLAAKLHCLTHSCKLCSRSWRDCVRLLNCTCSWTGDLGTESGVAAASADIRTLFGPWVVDVDAADDPPGGSGAEGNDSDSDSPAFHFGNADAGGEPEWPDVFLPDDEYTIDWKPSLFHPRNSACSAQHQQRSQGGTPNVGLVHQWIEALVKILGTVVEPIPAIGNLFLASSACPVCLCLRRVRSHSLRWALGGGLGCSE